MPHYKLKLVAKITLYSFSILHTIIISGCSSTKDLNSELFNGTSYRIDGRSDEWRGKKMLDLKDEALMVGIQNDANYMYICLLSSDRAAEHRMSTAGMIVWIEPEHGKRFGVHYPLPLNRTPGATRNDVYGYHTEMEILGPEKNAVAQSSILTSVVDYGITTAFLDSAGIAVLELKIPRKVQTEPYGIGQDTVVTMTIESGKTEHPSGDTHQGAGIGGGGRRRHGGDTQSGTPSESGTSSGTEGTQSSDYPDGGRGNAGERRSEGSTSTSSISVNLRVHLVP